VDKTEELKEQK
jgi:hypothetical protein